MENDEFSENMFSAGKACSTRFPGGNLVDGLPPVASTGAASICRPCTFISRSDFLVFVKLVLEIPLWDFDERLRIDKYIYDLDSDKGACRLKCLARRTTRLKHRTDDIIFRISYVFQ